MRKNLTEIVFILDRSGSMSGLEADTIGGFNSMIEKQKKENGEALISTVLFDNVSEVIHDRVPVQKVEPMTDKDYSVRGCTALLDAIGGAIHHIGNVHKYARNEDVPEHTVPFPVSWTVKMKKKQKETQDILSYHTQAAGCSDKARAKASGGRQPIEECGRTGL